MLPSVTRITLRSGETTGAPCSIPIDSDQDRALYFDLLQEYALRFKLPIEGYCLMSNHVHLVAVPHRDDSLARALGRTHNDYARLIHIRRRESGHLWQNRFSSCPLDGYHLWQAMRYVELNPVLHGATGTGTHVHCVGMRRG